MKDIYNLLNIFVVALFLENKDYADSFNIKMNKIFPQASSFPQPNSLFPPQRSPNAYFFK